MNTQNLCRDKACLVSTWNNPGSATKILTPGGKRSALLAKNFNLAAKRLIAWIKRLTNLAHHLGPGTMHFIHVEK